MPKGPVISILSGGLDNSKPARIQISLFNKYCGGHFLSAISNWVFSQGIRKIEFQIADALQRYNIIWKDGVGIDEAVARSKLAGDKWLQVNGETIRRAQVLFDSVLVSRWECFLRHDEFPEVESRLFELLRADEKFKASIEQEIILYFKRSNHIISRERAELSTKFLIEEIAVSELTAKHCRANEIYPGPRLRPEQYLANSKDRTFSIGIADFVQVAFEDRSKR